MQDGDRYIPRIIRDASSGEGHGEGRWEGIFFRMAILVVCSVHRLYLLINRKEV